MKKWKRLLLIGLSAVSYTHLQLSVPCYMIHNTEDIKDNCETNNSRIIRRMGVREIRCGKQTIAEAVQTAMDELTEKGYRPYYICLLYTSDCGCNMLSSTV